MFDIIYTGGSICCLIDAMNRERDKKILIIEKNIIGGAWYIKNNKLCKNFETAGHMIVPENNDIGKKIIDYFQKYDCNLSYILEKDFKFDNGNYKGNGKEGNPLIAEDTWADFYFSVKNRLKECSNISFLKKEITDIKIDKNINTILCDDKELYCKKIVITPYSKINKIKYFDRVINLPYENIKNQHILLYVKSDNITITKNFQYFLDQNIIIDRISVAALRKDKYKYTEILSNEIDIILICRISKNFKSFPFDDTGNIYLKEIVKLKLLDENSKIIKCENYIFDCCYRKRDIFPIYIDLEKIECLNTRYMGHFLKNYV